jgi:hypothetical protein
MMLQWVIIGATVLLAGIYLYRLMRKTLKAPFCSDCAGCDTKKWVKLKNRLNR